MSGSCSLKSLLLASLGGAAGWWIAKWGVRVYALTANPPTRGWSDHLLDYTLDGRVLAYLVAISTATAVLLALAPTVYLSTLDINVTLKGGGRGATGGGRHPSLSRLLVIVEMALAVVLLAGAGSMVRSFLNLSMADLGVHTTDVTTMLLNLPKDRYRESTAQIAFFDRLKLRLESIPGIDAIAIASELPAATLRQIPYEIAGAPAVDDERRPTVPSLTIGPGYFGTLAATVLSGRDFNDFDHLSAAPVAIVNQRFASTQWPGADPLGKRLRLFDRTTAGAWRTVVGVVSNVEQNARDLARARSRWCTSPTANSRGGAGHVGARTIATPAGSLATAFRRAVQAVDADLPIWIGPFALDNVLLSMGNYWSIGNDAALFVVFAAIALLLASIGLYAVIAHAVSQRTQEIGVRIAIGAGARDILALVSRQALLPIVIGLTIGLTASLGVTPMLKSQLVDVSPTDPTTLIVAATVLAVSATLGCWIPARRALLVDPLVALRHD